MNISYSMTHKSFGLNKSASEVTNDAELLTGLFYGILKSAADKSKPNSFSNLNLQDPEVRRKLGYTGGGAALGGLLGALSSNENRTRNAIIGALLGGAGGYAFDRYGHKPTAEFINRRLKSKDR